MSFHRTNSNFSELGRMSSSTFLERDGNSNMEFSINQLRQEVREIQKNQYEQLRMLNELINILGPIFPRSAEEEAFVEASTAGNILTAFLFIIEYVFIFYFALV